MSSHRQGTVRVGDVLSAVTGPHVDLYDLGAQEQDPVMDRLEREFLHALDAERWDCAECLLGLIDWLVGVRMAARRCARRS